MACAAKNAGAFPWRHGAVVLKASHAYLSEGKGFEYTALVFEDGLIEIEDCGFGLGMHRYLYCDKGLVDQLKKELKAIYAIEQYGLLDDYLNEILIESAMGCKRIIFDGDDFKLKEYSGYDNLAALRRFIRKNLMTILDGRGVNSGYPVHSLEARPAGQ